MNIYIYKLFFSVMVAAGDEKTRKRHKLQMVQVSGRKVGILQSTESVPMPL